MLSLFSDNLRSARGRYEEFIKTGLAMGRRPDLTGGGLVRSSGGWSALLSLRQKGISVKSDERILGDGDFIDSVLEDARESMEQKYRLRSLGCDLEYVMRRVSKLFDLPERKITSAGKDGERVRAKSLAAFWAVRSLGMNGGRQSSVSEPISSEQSCPKRGRDCRRTRTGAC